MRQRRRIPLGKIVFFNLNIKIYIHMKHLIKRFRYFHKSKYSYIANDIDGSTNE